MTLVQCLLSAQAQERVWLQTPGLCLECSEGREACPFQQDWMERLRICGVPRLWTVLTRAVQEHSLGGMSGREQLGKHRKRQTALQGRWPTGSSEGSAALPLAEQGWHEGHFCPRAWRFALALGRRGLRGRLCPAKVLSGFAVSSSALRLIPQPA